MEILTISLAISEFWLKPCTSTCLFALNLCLERHEVVVGLAQVVHVARHAVVGSQLHLKLGDHRRDLLQPGQRDLHSLEALHVVVRVRPDAVPLVEHLQVVKKLIAVLIAICEYQNQIL